MSKKWYAVRKGINPGIYETWSACSKEVIGYKGAEYKSFLTYEQALEYMKSAIPFAANKSFDKLEDTELVAYVDGSYNDVVKKCGFGIVSFTAQGKKEEYGLVDNEAFIEFRNVSGEIYGSLYAMEKAEKQGKTEVFIHYDYAGIEYWATGEWKRNNDLTKWYKEQYDKYTKEMTVHFIKVAAHSGDIYNEKADELAKTAVGLV